jgi:hypothetical protein
VTWTPEQKGQRDQWALDALDDDPALRRAVDPLEAYRSRREHEIASLPQNGHQPLSEPPAEVDLLMPDGSLGSIDIATISTDPPPPMLIDRLDPEGHTILFGTGGVGKGALACWWIVQLVRSGRGVLVVDYEAHPAEWSRRIASLAPDVHSSGLVRHIGPKTPLRACAEVVADEARAFDLSVVVVDSAVMACGSDPLKPEVAGEYAAAVMRLGLPVLSLAHVTKADDMRYPFGSIFWHNLARTTWGLQADQSGAVVLSHRKHNNYGSLGRFAMASTWVDGRLMDVYERQHERHLKDRLAEVLVDGGLSLAEILDALNSDDEGVPVKRESVRRVLNKHIPETFRLSGIKYEMAS